jgi:hypothetical protein
MHKIVDKINYALYTQTMHKPGTLRKNKSKRMQNLCMCKVCIFMQKTHDLHYYEHLLRGYLNLANHEWFSMVWECPMNFNIT